MKRFCHSSNVLSSGVQGHSLRDKKLFRRFQALNLVRTLLLVLTLLLGLAAPAQMTAAPASQGGTTYVLNRIEELRGTQPTDHETFRKATGDWEVHDGDDYALYLAAGAYHVRVEVEDQLVWGNSPYSAANFYAEVDAFHEAGAEDNSFGLGFRQQENGDMYLFSGSSDGYYRFVKIAESQLETVVPWTETDLLARGPDTVNQIAVLADGPDIALLINGQVVEMLWDKDFTAGRFALSGSAPGDEEVQVAFDDLAIWSLSEPKISPPPKPTPGAAPASGALGLIAELKETLPTLSDFFTVETDIWHLVDSLAISSEIEDVLRVEVTEPTVLGFIVKNEPMPDDYLAEVDAGLEDADLLGRYGLAFRYEDTANHYLYLMDHNGFYGLWNYVDGDWEALIPFSKTSAANTEPGGVNRLGVLVRGDQITLLLNGEVLTTLEDDSHPTGTLALAAGTFDVPPVAVNFDNFDYWIVSER
jgi:hypothetical protein